MRWGLRQVMCFPPCAQAPASPATGLRSAVALSADLGEARPTVRACMCPPCPNGSQMPRISSINFWMSRNKLNICRFCIKPHILWKLNPRTKYQTRIVIQKINTEDTLILESLYYGTGAVLYLSLHWHSYRIYHWQYRGTLIWLISSTISYIYDTDRTIEHIWFNY